MVLSFSEVSGALPDVLDLLDWETASSRFLMEAGIHHGVRKWMAWEDFAKYAE